MNSLRSWKGLLRGHEVRFAQSDVQVESVAQRALMLGYLRHILRGVRYPVESAILEPAWELMEFVGQRSSLDCDMRKEVERALRIAGSLSLSLLELTASALVKA